MQVAASVLVLVLVACAPRPDVLVICHNANCADPHDLTLDDTLEGVAASLALTVDGRPAFDGMEMDVFWDRGRCLLAHDANDLVDHVDVREGAMMIADFLRSHADVAYNGERFTMQLELKPQLDEPDLASHVECALEVFRIVQDGARASGHELDLAIDSYDPALLRAFREHPAVDFEVRLGLDLGGPPPFSPSNLVGVADLDLAFAELHPTWTSEAIMQWVSSNELGLVLWTYDLTGQTLQAIRDRRPQYIVTGQARLMREWLAYD
jgi:hypothetical protein